MNQGNFGKWLKKNIDYSHGTCNAYMRFAVNRVFLESQFSIIANLGVVRADRLIQDHLKKEAAEGADDEDEPKKEEEDEEALSEEEFKILHSAYTNAREDVRDRFHTWLESTYSSRVIPPKRKLSGGK